MQVNIHPKTHKDATVTCSACGFTFQTDSTKERYSVEVCYKCHPFYTGKQKFLNTKGRVDKFEKKRTMAQEYQSKQENRKQKEKKTTRETKSLKELLGEI